MFIKEVLEGGEAPEPTEEDCEQAPEPLSTFTNIDNVCTYTICLVMYILEMVLPVPSTGRTTVFTKEVPEGEEAPEPTEEESEQAPEPLSTLEKDTEVEGAEAWTPVFSSTNSGVKNQVSHQLRI